MRLGSSHDSLARVSRRRGTRGAARLGAWLVGASPLLWAVEAALARENTPAPVYEVPRGCDTRQTWMQRLRERLPPLLRTHPLMGTLSVHVEKIDAPGNTAFGGELASTTDASLAARAVRGATCEEVLDALSFIAALGLERAASGGDGAATADASSSPERSAAAALAGSSPAVEIDELGSSGAPSPAPDSVRLGAAGFALLQNELTPGRSIAFGVALRFSWSASGWQPLLLLGAYSSLSERRRLEAGGSVRFEHWSTHTVACPFRFPRGGAWGVRPCIELDVGRSSGQAFDVIGAEKQAAPWLSGGAQLRAELVLWERVELVASAGAVAPFWYAHFFLLPDQESFTTPALGLRAGSYAALLF